ncbi:RNA 3'-terminal phosphate cyclase [Salinibaculum rarum]|uniref:RNA 3'-terminal phosphate cyclase n=1 Tax=Salinibaculum rarum TaxID=3058903 RepID=UPI00265FE2DB|nr:RNA 3'-terminal phosphate cyclase [Salinibaculum sp. KK48]
MLSIDGAAGGGQLLRTALSLSTITDRSFRIDDIRGDRPNPGLRPQHLSTVDLVADFCDADVEGAKAGAESLVFEPGSTCHTDLSVDVGTAGSLMLLFDTILPIGVTCDEPICVTATGGTNVKWSPTVEYHQHVKLPLLARYGLEATLELERTGFYPAGGGRATLETTPWTRQPLELDERGSLERVEIYSKASADLEDSDVADRQARHAAKLLDDDGFPVSVEDVAYVPSDSPGSSILLRAVYDRTLAGFEELGERGRPSEEVAEAAVAQFQSVHSSGATVDVHMADQLMVLLALAGGRLAIPEVTDHVRTNLELITTFGSDMHLAGESTDTPTLVASPLLDEQ